MPKDAKGFIDASVVGTTEPQVFIRAQLTSPPLSKPARPLLFVGLLLSGCVSGPPTEAEAIIAMGVDLPVSFSFQTVEANGSALFSVVSPVDITAYLRFSLHWSPDALNTAHIALIAPDGHVTMPDALRGTEHAPVSTDPQDDELYLDAGGLKKDINLQSSPSVLLEGSEFLNATAPTATLVILWAGLESPLNMSLHLPRGASVTPSAQGSALSARDSDFGGGISAKSKRAGFLARDRAFLIDPGEFDLYLVLKFQTFVSTGDLVVESPDQRRKMSLQSAGRTGVRVVAVLEGITTFQLNGVGLDESYVVLTAGLVPAGILPKPLWQEMRE